MEVDEEFELTVRIFQKGVRTNHQIVLNTTVATLELLRDILMTKLQLSQESSTLDVIYCGVLLKDLANIDLKSGSSINAIVKDNPSKAPGPVVSRVDFDRTLVRLFSPEYQYMTKTIITTTDTINEIIDRLPDLRQDLVAQGILKNFNMLRNIVQKENQTRRLYDKYPSLAKAVHHLDEIVVSRTGQDTEVHRSIPRQNNQYSIDGMSDDDAERELPRPPTHRITANQLAAAIASAGNPSSGPSGSQVGASTSSTTSTQPRGTSTQRGVQVPRSGPVPAASNSPSSGSAEKYSSQLAQIMGMGIADKNTALHALEAASGDVNLAVDIIYGGDMT